VVSGTLAKATPVPLNALDDLALNQQAVSCQYTVCIGSRAVLLSVPDTPTNSLE